MLYNVDVIFNLGGINHETVFQAGNLKDNIKFTKMENSVEKLNNHVIICGLGRNGLEAAQIMHDNEIPFVMLEVKEVEEIIPFDLKYLIIGDARNDEVLKKAGIERARALITTLPNDADNVYVVLSARQENPGIKIISRASQNSSVKKLKIAGATPDIMPDRIGGAHIRSPCNASGYSGDDILNDYPKQ